MLFTESRRLGKTIMFVKASGPVVFSDSSDSEDEEIEEQDDDNLTEDVIKFSKDSDSQSDSIDDNDEQPNKKKKYC